jgi:hypothetical protein
MFKKLAPVLSAIACLAILSVGVAAFVRARNTTASKSCINNLRQLDGVKGQWAFEHDKTTNDIPTWADLVGPSSYMREMPVCSHGGTYSLERIADSPTCSIGGPNHTLQ